MPQRGAVNGIANGVRRFEGGLVAEVANFLLFAIRTAEVDDLILQRLPAQFAESECRAERAGEHADVLGETARKCRIAKGHGTGGMLLILFIRGEIMQLVADERSAEAEAALITVISVVRGERREIET